MAEKTGGLKWLGKAAPVIGGAAVVAVAAGVGLGIGMSGRNRDDNEQKQTGYVLNEDNYVNIIEDMSAEVAEGYFETYMNTDWVFKNGTAKTNNALFGNSPNNTKPIRMEVILDGTGEKVYSSGVLPVGAVLSPFQLNTDLDAGVYSATCMVYLMRDAGDGTYVDFSSAGFKIKIIVEE